MTFATTKRKRGRENGEEGKWLTDGGKYGGGRRKGWRVKRKEGKTQSKHKSCDIDFAANFPRCRSRRIRDSSCDAAITSLAGIKIQLYIKLSYIAPYLYLSHWYFLRFPFLRLLSRPHSPTHIHALFREFRHGFLLFLLWYTSLTRTIGPFALEA